MGDIEQGLHSNVLTLEESSKSQNKATCIKTKTNSRKGRVIELSSGSATEDSATHSGSDNRESRKPKVLGRMTGPNFNHVPAFTTFQRCQPMEITEGMPYVAELFLAFRDIAMKASEISSLHFSVDN
ncbi:hypothetical protein N7540_009869 [Penicillium herquei]|nr:hypothetical protein N7540_009869 [Penicillium herquei]